MPSPRTKPKNGAATAADRRKQILKAAVEVFAERGFHRTRVSDIARHAGVAYGLIYHYFESKEDVLNSIFDENWAVFLKVLGEIRDDSGRSAGEKLTAISGLLIDALGVAPNLIQVLIQEISRSDRFVDPPKLDAFQEAFRVVKDIISEGQARGEIDAESDPWVMSYIFFGALETVCTGFLLKAIPCSTEEEANRLKQTLSRSMLLGMLTPDGVQRLKETHEH